MSASAHNDLPNENDVEASRTAFVRRDLRKGFVCRAKMDAAVLIPYSATPEERLKSPTALQRIRDIAHGLAGMGGVFGFTSLSTEAKALEDAVAAQLNGSGALVDVKQAIDTLLAEIDAAPMP